MQYNNDRNVLECKFKDDAIQILFRFFFTYSKKQNKLNPQLKCIFNLFNYILIDCVEWRNWRGHIIMIVCNWPENFVTIFCTISTIFLPNLIFQFAHVRRSCLRSFNLDTQENNEKWLINIGSFIRHIAHDRDNVSIDSSLMVT